jgi:hypothetical protein
MTRRRAIVAALAVLLLGLIVWKSARVAPTAPGRGTPAVTLPSRTPAPSSSNSAAARDPAPPERSTLADALNSPSTDIKADLRLVLEIIETFRSNFLQTGNPVGTNADITSALSGRNRLRLALIPIDHPAINKEGELCDRWGMPFFFHAESATRMEVRSAGPDRKMWSNDDVVLSP